MVVASVAAGTHFGRYEILKHLATGGMAELLLARARGLEGFERHFAIKRIRVEQEEDPMFVEMFLAEARLAAALHHHNIVQVHDIGQENGKPYFVMEYVHGENLRKLMATVFRRREMIPLQHVIGIVSSIAVALHHAHEAVGPDRKPLGIVHRDVTPANILIGYDGNVKVVDFGIAKAAIRRTNTQAGMLKGKAPYMSPEQCTGAGVDRRSDVFALGILLYELVTVRRLFKGSNDFVTMGAIVRGEIPRPSLHREDLPPQLEAVILRALARDPEARYQTAEEVNVALEACAAEGGWRLSTTALAAYMRELFGRRPEPWLVSETTAESTNAVAVDFDGSVHGLATAPRDAVPLDAEPAATKSSPIAMARERVSTEATPIARPASEPATAVSPIRAVTEVDPTNTEVTPVSEVAAPLEPAMKTPPPGPNKTSKLPPPRRATPAAVTPVKPADAATSPSSRAATPPTGAPSATEPAAAAPATTPVARPTPLPSIVKPGRPTPPPFPSVTADAKAPAAKPTEAVKPAAEAKPAEAAKPAADADTKPTEAAKPASEAPPPEAEAKEPAAPVTAGAGEADKPERAEDPTEIVKPLPSPLVTDAPRARRKSQGRVSEGERKPTGAEGEAAEVPAVAAASAEPELVSPEPGPSTTIPQRWLLAGGIGVALIVAIVAFAIGFSGDDSLPESGTSQDEVLPGRGVSFDDEPAPTTTDDPDVASPTTVGEPAAATEPEPVAVPEPAPVEAVPAPDPAPPAIEPTDLAATTPEPEPPAIEPEPEPAIAPAPAPEPVAKPVVKAAASKPKPTVAKPKPRPKPRARATAKPTPTPVKPKWDPSKLFPTKK